MGLLGLFTLGGMIAGALGDAAHNSIVDAECIRDARIRNQIYYTDRKGVKRLLSNGHECLVGKYRIRDKVTGEIVIDYEKIGKEKRKEDAIASGATVWCPDPENEHWGDICQGVRYVDLNNDSIYVVRSIVNDRRVIHFFMDPETGLFVKPSDDEIYYNDCLKQLRKKYLSEFDYQNILNDFNEKQRDLKNFYLYSDNLYFHNIDKYPLEIPLNKDRIMKNAIRK